MELQGIEYTILEKIKHESKKILFMPVDIWINLITYSELIEDYEMCGKLMNLIDIVSLQTFKDFIEQEDREWINKQQSLNKSWKS